VSRKRAFIVTLEIPEGCTVEEIRQYIDEAVSLWAKSTDPDEPLFELDGEKVKVRPMSEPKHTSQAK
jgi:hypothetical protein